MTGNDHSISVWFLCKSCGYTFHFQHVDEFLEHKKQVHFSEYKKIRCIVLEEKLDDNQEQEPYQDFTPEILYSNTFHIDTVDLPEGEVACFLTSEPEPEPKPPASNRTKSVATQDSSDASELLAFEDPNPVSSVDLEPRLTSPEIQFPEENEIKDPAIEVLSITSLQPMPTSAPLQHDEDELPGFSCSSFPSQEVSAANSDLSSPAFNKSKVNRIVSFSTDPTEKNKLIVEITESQNDPSSNSSEQDTLTDVLVSSQANLEPSWICVSNDVTDEFEDSAAIDVTEEIYVDFETVVHGDEINLKLEVEPSGITTCDERSVKEKSETNANIKSKYNPYVLVKRLKLTDLAIGQEKDTPSEHSDYGNDGNHQPCSPLDSNGSDSDFHDDESRTIIKGHKRYSSSRIRVRQEKVEFIFPSPESDSEDVNAPLTLKDWLLQQMETTYSSASTNVIILDPDPNIENVEPVTPENPITCKLCSKKLVSKSEVKVHVKHCWLLNKKRHRFCVTCAKSYSRPDGLKKHNQINHGTEERHIFKCQYCPEKFENKINRNRHEDKHPEKPKILKTFACKFCNKSFCFKSTLRLHLTAHSNDRPFKCDHPNCSFAGKRLGDLKLHKRSHGNPRNRKFILLFKFPYFEIAENDNESDHVTLAGWIAKQTEEFEGAPTNVILLEPDPTKENVGPITQENYISCKLCCEKLTSESRVKIHATHCWFQNKTRHKYCILCDKKYLCNAHLRVHCVKTHGTEEEKANLRNFKCHQCPKTYWNIRDLRIHVETHKSKDEQNRPFVCETCGLRFFLPTDLRLHLRSHSNDRPFKCLHPNCTQAFKTTTSRNTHMQTHSDSRPHECPYPGCSKSFKTSFKLKTHYQVHTGKRYECTHRDCNKTFANSGKLKLHVKAMHTEGGIEKKFECNICHKKFAQKYTLTQHAPIHLNLKDKPFKCSHKGCKEAFNIKRILDEHELKHTGEQPFVCDTCGKAYAKEWSFKKHLRVHENAHNKHACPICPRKFPGTWELKQHLLIHEKGKQFICSQCGQKCMTKANLNLHEKTHSKGNNMHKRKRKNVKKVETSSESESQNDSSSESEGISNEASISQTKKAKKL